MKTHWEPDEIEYLRIGFLNHVSATIVAHELGRSLPSVYFKLDRLGLWRRKTGRWTQEQVALIKANYQKTSADDMLRQLGRKIKVGAVVAKANALGLIKTKRHRSHNRPWTPTEDKTLLTLWKEGRKRNDPELQRKLNRTQDAIQNRCSLLAAKKLRKYAK